MSFKMLIVCLSLGLASAALAGQFGGIAPEDIAAVWLFEEGKGDVAKDTEGQGIDATLVNGASWEPGLRGMAVRFDGVDDGIKVPDSKFINTGGPFPNRTVMALFKCDDVSITDRKQTIYEEGGRTRGFVIYVYDGQVWVGGWNRAEYKWNGEWLSTPIESNQWYYVAFVLRNGAGAVEPDRFEMWLNGRLVAKASGGQLYGHGDDTGIGYVNQNTVFHDDDGSGTNIHHFAGLIDELRVYNAALTADDMSIMVAVEPQGKLATRWGDLKQP